MANDLQQSPSARGETTVSSQPGYAEPIYQTALDHIWIHGANYVELAEKQGLHVFERGKGCMLYDARGAAWIDALSGLWVVNVGHGRQEIA
jgi:hypothetical protein